MEGALLKLNTPQANLVVAHAIGATGYLIVTFPAVSARDLDLLRFNRIPDRLLAAACGRNEAAQICSLGSEDDHHLCSRHRAALIGLHRSHLPSGSAYRLRTTMEDK
jgi:hypothetical protein